MRELLRCSVTMGCVTLVLFSVVGQAGEPLLAYSQMAKEKLNAQLPPTKLASEPFVRSLPAVESQNLRMDCEKIGQAQRSLKDARRSGARLTPAAPFVESQRAPPTRDEVYHISRNEERFADFARQFQCSRR